MSKNLKIYISNFYFNLIDENNSCFNTKFFGIHYRNLKYFENKPLFLVFLIMTTIFYSYQYATKNTNKTYIEIENKLIKKLFEE